MLINKNTIKQRAQLVRNAKKNHGQGAWYQSRYHAPDHASLQRAAKREIYGEPLFSLIQYNAQYVGKLSSYFNQVMCDFWPHQTKCASCCWTPKASRLRKSAATRAPPTSSVLRAADIFRPAIIRNCPGLILCHKHPSGDPTPLCYGKMECKSFPCTRAGSSMKAS
jgi:hypothetical protein